MKTLTNLITELIAYEPDENAKLEMLTSISITTQNDNVWEASESVRDELFTGSSISKEDILASLQKPSSTESEVEGAVNENYGTNGEGTNAYGLFV